MKTREYYENGTETRAAIVRVAEVLGNTMGNTLGPGGRNYLTQNGITNDGKTIVQEMEFADNREQLIADIIKIVPLRTDNEVGDGTTSATVLATKLIEELLPKVVDINTMVPGTKTAMDYMRELESEKDSALAILKGKVRKIETLEDLEKVATTAMEDKDNAKVVAKAIFEGGKDSSLVIDEGFSGKVETEVVSGTRTPFTLATPGNREVRLMNVPVIVVMHVFEAYRELAPFMASLVAQPKQDIPGLVIVAKQFSVDFVKEVMQVSRETRFPILLVENSQVEKDAFEDVAVYCGARLIDTHPKTGVKISSLTFKDTGFVKKIQSTPKGTLFIEGRGTKLKDETTPIQAHVMELRSQLEKEKVEDKRKRLELRMAELLGGIVTIRVDAKTAAEKFYLKLKVEDAMNSCKNALEGGMVRGGGVSLKETAEALGPDSLLYNTLSEPYRLIQRNHGVFEIGPDVEDAFLTVKAGLEAAISVVKILLTTEGVMAQADPHVLDQLKTALK